MSNYVDYDPDVNYDELEQHTYSDTPGHIFYIYAPFVVRNIFRHSSYLIKAEPCVLIAIIDTKISNVNINKKVRAGTSLCRLSNLEQDMLNDLE